MRAGNPTPASANEASAPSERRGEAVVADAKDFIDFWGRRVDSSWEASRGAISRALYRDPLPEKERRYARWPGVTNSATPGPRALFERRAKSEPHPHPPPGPHPPVRHRAHQPGGAGGPKRCGRLGATPGDAPVASTPPRRREPGPVSAFRRSRRTVSRGEVAAQRKYDRWPNFGRGGCILAL